MSSRWRKVIGDLWYHKSRSALVILSIMVGIAAIGAITSIQVILQRDLQANYNRSNPMSAVVYARPFQADTVNLIRQMDEIKEAEGRYRLTVRVEVQPNQWQDLILYAAPDVADQRINKVFPQSGAWPPGNQEILLERSSLSIIGVQAGSPLRIETSNQVQRELTVSGFAHDPTQFPVAFSGVPYGYISMETLAWLGQPRAFNELNFIVAENALDAVHIEQVADRVQDAMRTNGQEPLMAYHLPPGKHPAGDAVQALTVILSAIGLLTLLLSASIIVNTIAAVLVEQVKQIGTMKAVGARRRQIIGIYAGMVLTYGAAALILAIPFGMLITRWFVDFVARLLNFDVMSYAVPASAVIIQVVLALLFPLLVALIPIARAMRGSVHAALSESGMGNGAGRMGRFAWTLLTLTLAGATTISVMSVGDSSTRTVDGYMEHLNYDVQVNLDQLVPQADLLREARTVDGVTAAESWIRGAATVRRADGTTGPNYMMVALPPDTSFVRPHLVEGRWLAPGDENAIVLDALIRRTEPGVTVGSTITIKTRGREHAWQVVGIVQGNLVDANLYVSQPYFSGLHGAAGLGSTVQVKIDRHDAATQTRVETDLKQRMEARRATVLSSRTLSQTRNSIQSQFNIIVSFLLMMSLLLLVVGGLGLTGTLSINVIQRTREIGVLRAIGASTFDVMKRVMGESLLIGLLSWVLGSAIAIPLSKVLSYSVGMAFTHTPLTHVFSVAGAVLWLVVALLLATVASLLPAWRAARVSVRAALAY